MKQILFSRYFHIFLKTMLLQIHTIFFFKLYSPVAEIYGEKDNLWLLKLYKINVLQHFILMVTIINLNIQYMTFRRG